MNGQTWLRTLSLEGLCVLGWLGLNDRGSAHCDPGAQLPEMNIPRLNPEPAAAADRDSVRMLVFLRGDARYTSEVLHLCRRMDGSMEPYRRNWQPSLVWIGELPNVPGNDVSVGPDWFVGQDGTGAFARACRVVVSPTIYLIDHERTVRHVFPGWHPLLERELLQALAEDLRLDPAALVPPISPAFGERERAELYYRLGRLMSYEGRWEEALAHYERGLTHDAGSAQALAEAARAPGVTFDRDGALLLAGRALMLEHAHPLAQAIFSNAEGRPASIRVGWGEDTPFYNTWLEQTAAPVEQAASHAWGEDHVSSAAQPAR